MKIIVLLPYRKLERRHLSPIPELGSVVKKSLHLAWYNIDSSPSIVADSYDRAIDAEHNYVYCVDSRSKYILFFLILERTYKCL